MEQPRQPEAASRPFAPVSADIARRVSVGIAGWSYPDWDGYVYPGGTRDKLRYVAGYVDMVEINTTFYRPPDRATTASWDRRTRDLPDFFFTAKLHQDITHHGRLEPALVAAIREGLAPLTEAGRLRHLLAQFRWDFCDSAGNRRHLEAVRRQFGNMAVLTLELRNKSWESESAQTFLSNLGVTVANLDYPTASNSFSMRLCTVGQDAYFRLHGRNAHAWFDRDAGRDETYNYCYEPGELDGIVDRSVELAKMTRSLTLVANNHFQGKEMLNALEIKSRLIGGKVFVPPDLAARYPRIRPIARPPPNALRQPQLPLGEACRAVADGSQQVCELLVRRAVRRTGIRPP